MSNIDIKDIEKNLHKRLNYQDKNDEEKYDSERKTINNKYPDEGFRSVEVHSPNGGELNRLEQKKHWDIRKKLNDDEGFNEIEKKLPDIENMITEKRKELSLLHPKSPHFFQTAYTKVTGKKNTADIAKENFDNKKKGLDSELNTLETIKHNIQKLIPIYKVEKLSDLYNSPTIVVNKEKPTIVDNEEKRVKTSEELNKPIENKRGVMVRAKDMVVGKTYKLMNDDIVTLTDKGPFTASGLYNRDIMGAITFSNGETYREYADVMYEEVAQEGGKRKTRRQRKSRKARRRQTNRRR